MLIDSRILPADTVVETDVCIVGAGPSGISIAKEFINESFQVCLLESGSVERPDAQTQSLAEVEHEGSFHQIPVDSRNRRFGGNSSYWGVKLKHTQVGVRLRPLDKIDFEQRDWIPYSGWPFDKTHLDPYYTRAQEIFDAGPIAYEIEDWQTTEPQSPFQSLNLRSPLFQFGNGLKFFQDHRKAIEKSENITTYLHANVMEIETDETGQHIERVRVGCLNGNQFWISARIFILAAGAVENTQLLLLSNKKHPEGIGNQHGLVGRFFMDHPIIEGGIIKPFNRQIFNQSELYDMRDVNGIHVMGGLSLSEEMMRKEKLPNLVSWLFPRPSYFRPSPSMQSLKRLASSDRFANGKETFVKDIATVLGGADDLAGSIYRKATRKPIPFWSNLSTGGWSHLQPNREREYSVFEVVHLMEQTPNPENQIKLSERLDLLGRRRIELCAGWNEFDLDGFTRSQQALARELRQAKIGEFQMEREPDGSLRASSLSASHHIGTTRMHVNPKEGVVDANCKVHGITNLYIASSSVFPTGGYANPTLTIVALAIRLADRIKATIHTRVELK